MRKCYVEIESELKEADFIGVYQISNVIDHSPFVGGHPGGVIAYPVAVVKLNGKLERFNIGEISFNKKQEENKSG